MVRGTRYLKIITCELITNKEGNIFVTVNKSHTVHGRRGRQKLNEDRSNPWPFCLILHVLIHLLVCFLDSLHIVLKFQAHIYETVSIRNARLTYNIWGLFFSVSPTSSSIHSQPRTPLYLLCSQLCSKISIQHLLTITKGLLLTCTYNTSKGAESVTALECSDDSLVEGLQEWSGGDGEILSLDIWIGEAKILQMLCGIIKDKVKFEC